MPVLEHPGITGSFDAQHYLVAWLERHWNLIQDSAVDEYVDYGEETEVVEEACAKIGEAIDDAIQALKDGKRETPA